MMRGWVVTAALVLTFVAAFAQALVMPQRVLACSCMWPPPTLAEVAAEGGVAILTGTVGQSLGDRIPIAVDRWFFGHGPSEVVFVRPAEMPDGQGGFVADTCSLHLSTGEERLFVVYGGPGAIYSTSNCAPGGRLTTEDGRRTLAEAEETFGEVVVPSSEPIPQATDPPVVPRPSGPNPIESGWFFLAGALGAAGLIFVAVLVLGRRRQQR